MKKPLNIKKFLLPNIPYVFTRREKVYETSF